MKIALVKHKATGHYVKYYGFLAPISDDGLLHFVNNWGGDFTGDGRSPFWKDFWLHLTKSYIAQKVVSFMQTSLNDPQAYLADMGKGFSQWQQSDQDFAQYMQDIDQYLGADIDKKMQDYFQEKIIPQIILLNQGAGIQGNSYNPQKHRWAMSREWLGLAWSLFDKHRNQIVYHSMPLFVLEQYNVGVPTPVQEIPAEQTVVKPIGKKFKKLLTVSV